MKFNKITIVTISILVPAIVALLFVFTKSEGDLGPWVHKLPKLNVTVNSLTIIVLLLALAMIKNGKEKLHRNLMLLALGLGSLFLVSYLTYHANVPSTLYGDNNHDHILSAAEQLAAGSWRTVYLVILLLHILFAVLGLPLVLLALYHGINDNRQAHKKIVRFTYPVWMFIAVSGVIVYFLISPYY